jgi:hypothetical protein
MAARPLCSCAPMAPTQLTHVNARSATWSGVADCRSPSRCGRCGQPAGWSSGCPASRARCRPNSSRRQKVRPSSDGCAVRSPRASAASTRANSRCLGRGLQGMGSGPPCGRTWTACRIRCRPPSAGRCCSPWTGRRRKSVSWRRGWSTATWPRSTCSSATIGWRRCSISIGCTCLIPTTTRPGSHGSSPSITLTSPIGPAGSPARQSRLDVAASAPGARGRGTVATRPNEVAGPPGVARRTQSVRSGVIRPRISSGSNARSHSRTAASSPSRPARGPAPSTSDVPGGGAIDRGV